MGLAFDGVSGSVTTTLTSHSATRTYAIWAWIDSNGENGKGRIFDKGTSSPLLERWQIEEAETPDAICFFAGFDGATEGTFSIARPSTGAWHHLALTWVAAAGNTAVMYLNGVAQTLQTSIVPAGAQRTNALPYMLGNRPGDDRTWHGKLAEFAVWDAILGAAEIAALAKGISPKLTRPSALVSYIDLVGYA